MKCAYVSCLFADKPNNSKAISLFAHPGSHARLGPTALEPQKNRSLFLKQCTREKKNCHFKNTVYTPQKRGTIHFLSTLICLHCTRGLLWNRKAGTGRSSGKNLPPSPFFSSLSLRGLFFWRVEGRKGWFSILKENLWNKYSKRKPQPKLLKGRTSTIDIGKSKRSF